MTKKGFTVAEVLITLSIVAILSALLYPLISSAVGRGKERKCASNLRQFGMALDMYRSDNDGVGRYGTPAQMGLPHPIILLKTHRYVSAGLEKCDGTDPYRGVRGLYAQFWQGYGDTKWAADASRWGDETISLFDTNHRNRADIYQAPLVEHFGIGLALGGDVRTRIRRGLPEEQAWWH